MLCHSLLCCLVSYISACTQFVIALVFSAVAQCTRDRCVHAPSQRSRAVDHRPMHNYSTTIVRTDLMLTNMFLFIATIIIELT